MNKRITRRQTRQRQIILEELRRVRSHPSADGIFRLTRRRLPKISFGTVYRNLNLLSDEGEILELVCGKYSCRYDGTVRNHYHFFCLECQRVFDLDGPTLKSLDVKVTQKTGFKIQYHRIDFYGYCKRCKT